MAKKKPQEIEYRLTVAPHFNERTQRPTTLITLETMKAFATFRYEISVREEEDDNTLTYKILGLKTPQLSLPSSGSARFVKEYEDLSGPVNIRVESLDGTVAECTVSISGKSISLLKSPKKSFIEFVVA